jgi:opacity protein-like surface antigen
MKTLLTAAALAIAFLAPAAEARVAKHQDTSHASSTVKAKTAKKAGKAKTKKHAKKGSHKTGL